MKLEDGDQVIDEDKTNEARSALEEFLRCLGTYSPEHYMGTVMQEATSYQWVLDRIQESFNLNTKGVQFLSGCPVKADSGDGQTHQQLFQAVKEHFSSSLMKKGEKYKGTVLDKDEVFTPFGENILVEKWLDLININLKSHIIQTRGSLFTDERPSLFDNQRQLCQQMDVLLKEVEQKESPSINRAGFAPQPPNRRYGGQPNFQPRTSYQRPRPPTRTAPGQTSNTKTNCPSNMCFRCYEAGRFNMASRTHQAANCPHSRPRARILLVNSREQAFEPFQTQPARIQEVQFTDELLQQGDQEDNFDQEGTYGQEKVYEDNWDYDFNNLVINKRVYPYPCVDPSVEIAKNAEASSPNINLVPTKPIQKFTFLSAGKQAELSIDSGAEANCIREDEAIKLKLEIGPLEANDRIPTRLTVYHH